MKNSILLLFFSFFLYSCISESISDISAPIPEKVKYNTNIKNIMSIKCNLCHKGSTATSYLTYIETKNAISEILNRIQKNEGSSGAMPQGGPKLSQSEINLFIKWQEDGLLE